MKKLLIGLFLLGFISCSAFAWGNFTTNDLIIYTSSGTVPTTTDAIGTFEAGSIGELLLMVNYDETEVVAGTDTIEATMTVYGTNDKGVTKYAIGIAPILTYNTFDADGAITYTSDTTVAYRVPGSHKQIYVDWNVTRAGGTAECTGKVWAIGKEF